MTRQLEPFELAELRWTGAARSERGFSGAHGERCSGGQTIKARVCGFTAPTSGRRGVGICRIGSDSICFSPDGRTLYYCDSLQPRILCCDYDAETAHTT